MEQQPLLWLISIHSDVQFTTKSCWSGCVFNQGSNLELWSTHFQFWMLFCLAWKYQSRVLWTRLLPFYSQKIINRITPVMSVQTNLRDESYDSYELWKKHNKNCEKLAFWCIFFLFGVCARCARHPTAPEDLWCRCQLSGGKNGATSQLSLVPASTPSFLVPKNGNGGHLSFEGDNSFNSFATMNKRNHINHPTLNDFGAKRQIQRYPKYSKMNSWNLLLPVHLWLTPLRFWTPQLITTNLPAMQQNWGSTAALLCGFGIVLMQVSSWWHDFCAQTQFSSATVTLVSSC